VILKLLGGENPYPKSGCPSKEQQDLRAFFASNVIMVPNHGTRKYKNAPFQAICLGEMVLRDAPALFEPGTDK